MLQCQNQLMLVCLAKTANLPVTMTLVNIASRTETAATISPKHWEALRVAGANSNSLLQHILKDIQGISSDANSTDLALLLQLKQSRNGLIHNLQCITPVTAAELPGAVPARMTLQASELTAATSACLRFQALHMLRRCAVCSAAEL